MDQIIPIQFIKSNFITVIKKTELLYKYQNSSYFHVITNFGPMCLVIEHFQQYVGKTKTIQFLNKRKEILQKFKGCFPLVYQQKICVNHPQQIACISLTQVCKKIGSRIVNQSAPNRSKRTFRIKNIQKFVKCMQILQKQQLRLKQIPQDLLLYYEIQSDYNLNFTHIIPNDLNSNSKQSLVQICIKQIQQLLTNQNKQQLNQIILIQDKIYKVQPKLLSQAKIIQQLMIILNLCPNLRIQIQLKFTQSIKNKHNSQNLQSPTKKRYKTIQIQQLQGNQKIKIGKRQYSQFVFIDGKCINALQQQSSNKSILNSIKTSQRLKIKKLQHIYIEFQPQSQLKLQSQSKSISNIKSNTIVVEQPIQKIQFISFIIFYLKLLEPIVTSISYIVDTNSLKLEYLTKDQQKNQKITKYLFIKFYDNYIVKDQQISMILQRSKLKNCKLDLKYMKINDTLLMFLANSQKTAKLIEINVSDCHGVTDSGINILVMSPYCKKLQSLSLILKNNLFQPTIESLSTASKPELKKLYLQQNPRFLRQSFSMQQIPIPQVKYDHRHHHHHHHNQSQLNLSKLKITQLYTFGINIQLYTVNLSNLKILNMTQSISVQEFRFFVKLELKQLKVKIIDIYKKSIIQSTSSFITQALTSKNNYLRSFAQGPSSKSLKILDLSDSNIKFKSLKPLFTMPNIQKLILNSCTNIGTQIQPINPKILSLSLISTQISINNLQNLIQKTPILIQLNLINNSQISDQQLVTFINMKKKYINNLIVCDNCYSHKLIENKVKNLNNMDNNGFQLIENVGIYVGRLIMREFNEKSQQFIYGVLQKLVQTVKTIKFITKYKDNDQQNQIVINKILAKVISFLKFTGKSSKYIKNLYIDRFRFEQLYQKLSQQQQQPIQKLTIKQNQIISLQIPISYPISFLLYKLTSISSLYSNKLLILNLNNNKTLQKQCIKMLIDYPSISQRIIDIDFRNCLFSFQDVVQWLFQLPMLQNVNRGVCKFVLNEDKLNKLQKYLKFCMKLREIIDLSIFCQKIQQTQILYSVLFHIVDKHITIQNLIIHFSQLQLNFDSDLFFLKIFDMQNIYSFTLILENCSFHHKYLTTNKNQQKNKKQKENIFQGINRFVKLKQLKLRMPISVMPVLTLKLLDKIQIDLIDELNITQNEVNKIIRGISISNLAKQFTLNLSGCSSISSLSKVFTLGPNYSLLQKLPSLHTITLNFQYCSLKQSSINQLLHLLSKMPRIKKINLNFSFTITNLQQLLSKINLMVINIAREVKVYAVAVNQKSSQFVFNREFCKVNGVEFIC